MSTKSLLDEIDRIHDDEPQRAAAALRALDVTELSADKLPLYGFLLLHVLGEKFGQWDEAADLLDAACTARPDAPVALLAHAATAAHLADRSSSPAALSAMTSADEAKAVVALGALDWRPPADPLAYAGELEHLSTVSLDFDAHGPLNRRFAVGFNNTTSGLLDRTTMPVPAAVAAALRGGASAALRFWTAAGSWVEHERALYLRAAVANRVGDHGSARDDCRWALDMIAANGSEDVDRAFLQLQLAAALLRLGEAEGGQQALAEAKASAAAWDDAGLRDWFRQEHDRLFASRETS